MTWLLIYLILYKLYKNPMKKIYYIKDLERLLAVGRTTIFYWEVTGKIPKARRTPMGNYRWWTQGDLKRIKKIVKGRQLGSI